MTNSALPTYRPTERDVRQKDKQLIQQTIDLKPVTIWNPKSNAEGRG